MSHNPQLHRLDPGPAKGQGQGMTSQSLWANRNFRLLLASATATNLGDGLIAVAVPWLATRLTDDAALIGLVAAARHFPWVLFSLPAGVLTDRFDHRRLILVADSLRLVLSLALLALALTATPGLAPVLVLIGLSFLLGSAEVVRDNTAQTFLPAVVEKSQLERANGAIWSTEQLIGQMAGPPLAGFLIGLSLAIPFGLQTGLLLAALGLVGAMRLPPRQRTSPHLPPIAALKEGALWLWRDTPLRRLAFLLGGFNFLGFGTMAIFVLYAQRVLGLGAAGYGALLTAAAIGALSATFIGPRILDRLSPTHAILTGMVVFSATSGVMALGAPLWLVAVVMTIDGFAGMLWNLAQVSYRQRHIPEALLGRVNSAFRFIGTGPAAFGAFAFGWIIAAGEGAEAVLVPYAIAAIGGGLLTSYALFRLRLK